MPPSGFVRSSQTRIGLPAGRPIFLTALPWHIRPWAIDVEIVPDEPSALVAPRVGKTIQESHGLAMLVNNRLFFLPISSKATTLALSTSLLPDYGGEVSLLWLPQGDAVAPSLQVLATWRAWGEFYLHPYGYKPAKYTLAHEAAAIVSTHTPEMAMGDFILNDKELEDMHALGLTSLNIVKHES